MIKGIIFVVRGGTFITRGSGAHRIAHHLRLHGIDVEVVDYSHFMTLEELQEIARSRYSSDLAFYGFSTFFNNWNDTMNQFTAWLKRTYPNTPTVLGGQSVMITNATNIDYWIDSYGEVAMLELVKYLRSNGEALDTEIIDGKNVIKALHKYPAYTLDTYMIKYEKRDFIKPYEFLTTELGRGCKFKCGFCTFALLGVREDRSRSSEDFYDEMIYNYDNFGVTRYHFADETVNDRVEKIIKCAEAVDRLPFKPWYHGFVRADLLIKHKPHWDHYVKMNFGGQYYGIESFNKKASQVVGKGMESEKLKAGLLEIKNYWKLNNVPYRGTASMICGLPNDTEETWNDSVNWLLNNWTDQAVLTFCLEIPIPDYRATKESAFSENPEKFGIKQRKVFELKEHKVLNVQRDQLSWEHDTMNQHRATELVSDFQRDHSHKFMENGWHLNNFSVINQSTELDKLLSYSRKSTNTGNMAPEENTFIREYIENKLNWR